MSSQRLNRVNAQLHREIGGALYEALLGTDVDMARVTVTHVEITPDLREARVQLSVSGDEAVQRATLSAIRGQRVHIQETINRDMALKYTPRLHFYLDESLRKGDRVLEILSSLGIPAPDEGELGADPSAPAEDVTGEAP